MTCPSCKSDQCADGRVRCWRCLETELDRVKVNCEGRSKVNPVFDCTARADPAKHIQRKRYVVRSRP